MPLRAFRRPDSAAVQALTAAKQQWSARLRNVPAAARALTAGAVVTPDPIHNVVGVGIGEKLVGDRPTGVMALQFLVRRKYPDAQIAAEARLPAAVDGVPVDVQEVGVLRALPQRRRSADLAAEATDDPRVRVRPARPGCSVGFVRAQDPGYRMAGTFGALAADSGALYILSNNHVLADEGRLASGDEIVQPGLLDGGTSGADRLAALTRWVDLQPGGANRVDCALARPLNDGDLSNQILFIGAPTGRREAALDMTVHKFGRTTGYTAGRVTSADTDVWVQYDSGTFFFESQVVVAGLNNQPFSDAGDSGSLVLERQSARAVGLLFAGSWARTIVNPIGEVCAALGVELM
jgi:hypothetical protein